MVVHFRNQAMGSASLFENLGSILAPLVMLLVSINNQFMNIVTFVKKKKKKKKKKKSPPPKTGFGANSNNI